MTSAVIVAAGKGTRMGPGADKLFLEIFGTPIVGHTWRRFASIPEIDEVILVIRPGLADHFQELARQLSIATPYRFALGGAERQNSVWNGLAALNPQSEWVAIQDAARPCTSPATIRGTLAAAREHGAAVAAQRVTDTLKEQDDRQCIARNVDRSRLWAVQTPQCFRVDIIRRALEKVLAEKLVVTDDTAACELIGQPVRLVESAEPNPKLTTPSDLPYLEFLLGASRPVKS